MQIVSTIRATAQVGGPDTSRAWNKKKEKKNTYPAHASFNRVYLIILVRKGLVEKVNRRLIIIPELDPLKGDSFEFTSS